MSPQVVRLAGPLRRMRIRTIAVSMYSGEAEVPRTKTSRRNRSAHPDLSLALGGWSPCLGRIAPCHQPLRRLKVMNAVQHPDLVAGAHGGACRPSGQLDPSAQADTSAGGRLRPLVLPGVGFFFGVEIARYLPSERVSTILRTLQFLARASPSVISRSAATCSSKARLPAVVRERLVRLPASPKRFSTATYPEA